MITDNKSTATALGSGWLDLEVSNTDLVDKLAAYKRRVAGTYRPLTPSEINELPKSRMLVSTKIDGELWFLVSSESGVCLMNPRGKKIHGKIPILEQAKKLPVGTIIAGELFAKGAGNRTRMGDLAAAMGGGETAQVDAIRFSAFDLLQDSNTDSFGSYDQKHDRLKALLPSEENLTVLDHQEAHSPSEIQSIFDVKVASGEEEGLVIRTDSGLIFKLKPSISIDVVVVGYTIKADEPEAARSILLGLMDKEGNIQVVGGCGNLGGLDERKSLLSALQPLKCDQTIRYASQNGGLYTFVQPQIVVEIKLTDLQADKSDGTLSSGLLLNFSENQWKNLGLSPCPRPIHPVLVRIREDKTVDLHDIRLDQIQDYLAIEKETQIQQSDLPVSQIIRRKVWTKETKGQTAVRKLLVWKTNKEFLSADYPAYVVHWTDYSASRASPLDREIRQAPTEASANDLAELLIQENIKKGWELQT